jgi:hypothetical protein
VFSIGNTVQHINLLYIYIFWLNIIMMSMCDYSIPTRAIIIVCDDLSTIPDTLHSICRDGSSGGLVVSGNADITHPCTTLTPCSTRIILQMLSDTSELSPTLTDMWKKQHAHELKWLADTPSPAPAPASIASIPQPSATRHVISFDESLIKVLTDSKISSSLTSPNDDISALVLKPADDTDIVIVHIHASELDSILSAISSLDDSSSSSSSCNKPLVACIDTHHVILPTKSPHVQHLSNPIFPAQSFQFLSGTKLIDNANDVLGVVAYTLIHTDTTRLDKQTEFIPNQCITLGGEGLCLPIHLYQGIAFRIDKCTKYGA